MKNMIEQYAKPIKKLLIVPKKKKIWTYGTFEDHTEM